MSGATTHIEALTCYPMSLSYSGSPGEAWAEPNTEQSLRVSGSLLPLVSEGRVHAKLPQRKGHVRGLGHGVRL